MWHAKERKKKEEMYQLGKQKHKEPLGNVSFLVRYQENGTIGSRILCRCKKLVYTYHCVAKSHSLKRGKWKGSGKKALVC